MNKISNTTTSSGNNQTAVFSGIGIDQVLTPLGMNQDAEEMIKLFDIQETVFAEMAVSLPVSSHRPPPTLNARSKRTDGIKP